MMADIAVRAGASLTDRDDSSLPPVGRTARTPRKASPSLMHDSALCTASTIHAKTPISSSSNQGTINSSSMSTPTGTKLAVTTTYDSSAGGDEEDIHEDLLEAESSEIGDSADSDSQSVEQTLTRLDTEKAIALSQLQELEVAIKVRQVSKVDGRKIRWIEYRARKAELEKNNNGTDSDFPKKKGKSRRSRSLENNENILSVNNNNNSENTDNMKGEVISAPLVLESMKLQFLQGTENIEGAVTNGSNSDGGLHKSPEATQKRKSSRTRSQSTPKENKEVKSSPKTATRGRATQKSKSKSVIAANDEAEEKTNLKKMPSKETTVNGTSEILTKIENVPIEVPSVTTPAIMSSFKVKSPATSPGKPVSEILPSCMRPTYKSVTKGLREVRKAENGLDEVGKNENGVTTSSPEKGIDNDLKCITVTPSPLLCSPPPRVKSAESLPNKKKSTTPKKMKASLSKSVERMDSGVSISNGHHDTEKMSPKGVNENADTPLSTEDDLRTLNETLASIDKEDIVKKKRGRPPKRKLNMMEDEDQKITTPGKSSKRVETVIADVHNTMNGEPQSVIPLRPGRTILKAKKGSATKKSKKLMLNEVLPNVDLQDDVSVKAQEVKATPSEEFVSKGTDKTSRSDAKKKAANSKKGSDIPLDDSGISSTSSASVNNQTQTTPKSKSTKSSKGVRLGLLHPEHSVETTKDVHTKTNQQRRDVDVSDTKQKGEQEGKAEKSLAGRVIRRSETGKSPENIKQSQSKISSPKNEVVPSKENSTSKGNSTTKSGTQKLGSIQRKSTGRSSSLENINAFKEETKIVDDKSSKVAKGEGTNSRKSSSTGNSDNQVNLIEELPKRSQKTGVSLPGLSKSKNSPKDKQKEGDSEELPCLGEPCEYESHGLKKAAKGKGKAKSKDGNLNVQKDDSDDDVPLALRRTAKKPVVENSKLEPKKSLESKASGSLLHTSKEKEDITIDSPSLDNVSSLSKMNDEPSTEVSLEKPQNEISKELAKTNGVLSTGQSVEIKKPELSVAEKGKQVGTKQAKSQKEVGHANVARIVGETYDSSSNKGRQGKNQKDVGLLVARKTQSEGSAGVTVLDRVISDKSSEQKQVEQKPKPSVTDVRAKQIGVTKKTKKGDSLDVAVRSEVASNVISGDPAIKEKRVQENIEIMQVGLSGNHQEVEPMNSVDSKCSDESQNNESSAKVDQSPNISLAREMEGLEGESYEIERNTAGLKDQNKEIKKDLDTQENSGAVSTLPQNSAPRKVIKSLQQEEVSEVKIEKVTPTKNLPVIVPSSSDNVAIASKDRGDSVSLQQKTNNGEKEALNSVQVSYMTTSISKRKQQKESSSKTVEVGIEDTSKLVKISGPESSTKNNSVGVNEEALRPVKGSIQRNTESISTGVSEALKTAAEELNELLPPSETAVDTEIETESMRSVPELSTKVFYAKNKGKTNLLPATENPPETENLSLATSAPNMDESPEVNKGVDSAGVFPLEVPDQIKNNDSDVERTAMNDADQVSETQSPMYGKSKDKVPRILKQLFLDEGVQNMLKSMGDESESTPSEASVHKLRPKRPTEPMLASSPELEELFSTTKKRKRWSEVDTLYMDEGVLNLLTSMDPNSRRSVQDDAASDISQASSVRSVKTNKSSKSSVDVSSENRKRKLSGASTVSNTSTKSMQPPESKKICLEQRPEVDDPYDYNANEEETILNYEGRRSVELKRVLTPVPKKKGRPALPLSVKQKNKAIRMQLKIQKQKQMGDASTLVAQNGENSERVEDLQGELEKSELDFEEDNVNLAELQGFLRKEKEDDVNLAQLQGFLRKEKDDDVNLAQLQGFLRKEKTEDNVNKVGVSSKFEQSKKEIPLSAKSIPPLKIKLASDSVTISHISKPTLKKPSSSIPEPPKKQAEQPLYLQSKPQLQPQSQLPPSKPQRETQSQLPHLKPHQLQPQSKPQYEFQSQQPLSKPQPRPVPAVVSGASVSQLPDNREPPRPSTSSAGVYAVPQQNRLETAGTSCTGLPSLSRSYEFSGQGKGKARVGETLRQSQRASVRQSEANHHYRDIALRKFNNFSQIILSPSTTKMKNSLNSRVLRELCEALNTLKRDETVRMVLLTATGSTFCQGVDLTALQHPNLEIRKKNAENLVRGIKEFLRTLVQFPKPIVAGVNGNAMGLGVTMLPLFDLVIANDKAEFFLPYAKLGQIPEGGATYTFPNLFGKLKSMQLFLGHKVTAQMALEMGLASESIWPATFQQELIPKVALLATQSAQSMEATKALMNHHLLTKLELSLESECRLLLQHWTSPHFALLCKRFLDSHHIHLQKPVNLPL